MLIIHITIALSSLAFTTYVFFSPSKPKLHASYAFVAATLATGFYLVFANPAHMVQSCISSLVYLGLVSVGIVSAHAKLAKAE
jgi:hypothetical protein